METPELARKTRAIVFSDIQGYSKMMGEDESRALRLLEEHNALCVPLIKKCGGTILKFLGDAILSSFESASDAVHCGIVMQRALTGRNSSVPKSERIVVRIGIHIGDVVMKDGDVFGDGVNIAARIEPLAEPGGIAISQTVFDMIKARPEIQTVSLGPKELKNIKDAVNIYQVLIEAQAPGFFRRLAWAGKLRMLMLAAAAAAAVAGGVFGVRYLKKGGNGEGEANLLGNPGFEQGLHYWKIELKGNAVVVTGASLAHSGDSCAEFHSENGQRTVLFAASASGGRANYRLNPGDVVTWSDWVYRISGDGMARCYLRVSAANDANHNKGYSDISPVPDNGTAASWTQQRGSFTAAPGKDYIELFCDLFKNTVPAAVRFDDVYLHITPASQAGGPAAPANALVTAAPAPPPPPAQQPAPTPTLSSVASGAAVGIEWVRIPGGSFMMGSEESPQEWPIHRVTVKDFDLAKTPVTFKQYRACVAAGYCNPPHVSDGTCNVWDGSTWSGGILPDSFQGNDNPVVCVEWEQAQAFAKWAGGRLPSEAEWEYAARNGGKQQKYPWGGEKPSCELAVLMFDGMGCGRNSTWPVCSKPRGNTAEGLCDMAGNVWEWLQDWHHDSYNGAPADGSAWESPAGKWRIERGASWSDGAQLARAAARRPIGPAPRSSVSGFRVARDRRD